MFHYVFLDPLTIDDAVKAGEMGLGRLVEMLQAFQRDVLLAETDAWRVEEELGERVRAIPNIHQHERKQIGDLLSRIRRNSPLVIVEGDEQPEVSLADFAMSKAQEAEIDLILSPGETLRVGSQAIRSSLAKAHDTELSTRRSQLSPGLKFEQGSKSFEQVAHACFRKLVQHAETVRIYDYALEKYYNNDQPVNLKKLVRFLRDHAPKLQRLEIITLPHARVSLHRDVSDLRHEVDFSISVEYRQKESDMPHPRYFGADNRYLDIDRGIDLCDANDRCRLTQIKYAAKPE